MASPSRRAAGLTTEKQVLDHDLKRLSAEGAETPDYERNPRVLPKKPNMMRFTINPQGVFRFFPLAEERPQSFRGWLATTGSKEGRPWEEQGNREVWLDPHEGNRISMADSHQVVKETANIPYRPRRMTQAKGKGRHPGYGKRKGTREVKLSTKTLWMRRMLKRLLLKRRYHNMYMDVKGNVFKDKRAPMEIIHKSKAEKAREVLFWNQRSEEPKIETETFLHQAAVEELQLKTQGTGPEKTSSLLLEEFKSKLVL